MYTIPENMPTPKISAMTLASANVPCRNMRSGRIGSSARASTRTNAAVRTAAAVNRPMITAESHA